MSKVFVDKKISLKGIFIYRSSYSGRARFQYDVVFITHDFQYLEYQFILKKQEMSVYVLKRLIELFKPFKLSPSTLVISNTDCPDPTPLEMFLQILQLQIGFRLFWNVEKDVMLRKIGNKHQMKFIKNDGKPLFAAALSRVWNKLIELDICPWINSDVEYEILNFSIDLARRKRLIRLAAYYIVIRDYYYGRYKYNKNIYAETDDIAVSNKTHKADDNNYVNITI